MSPTRRFLGGAAIGIAAAFALLLVLALLFARNLFVSTVVGMFSAMSR